jgi:hypothetical protein
LATLFAFCEGSLELSRVELLTNDQSSAAEHVIDNFAERIDVGCTSDRKLASSLQFARYERTRSDDFTVL